MSASKTLERNKARSLTERYEMLRRALAHYLLLQVGTFVAGFGFEAIGPAMNVLTEKQAELKVQDIRKQGETSPAKSVRVLSQNLIDSMGETFNSDYTVESGDTSRTVNLARCGCIESVVEQSEAYGLSKVQAKSIFCGACMGGYKKAAGTLGLEFKGKLSTQGCSMSFSTK